ncbi:MAG: glycoside hydrolase family 9 protein, partial [Planctomycetes bacterium]|nr:glycoside hydrolase family 9 protein [Planctomycetota bacterium]
DGAVFERMLKRGGKDVGLLVGPDNRLHVQSKKPSSTGRPLDRNLALKPETWTLTNATGEKIKITHVALKQKPLGRPGSQVRDNWYAITCEKDIQAGQSYTLNFGQYDLKESFTIDYKKSRSEAVHASHIGYRPSDPAKIGFLSYWSGTGGALSYSEGMVFSLVNTKTQENVFSGKTTLRMTKDKTSYGTHAKGKNYTLTDVYVCDFSAFKTAGNYVLSVDGVGCSFPFDISRDAWTVATKNSLRGFFHQRASQEWKKPWADWDQPRAFHPDNGEDYWELSKSKFDIIAETGKRSEDSMATGKFEEWKTGKKVANAWGGYYDAGDYDRHTEHLICSRNMLELVEIFPAYYKDLKLPIPEDKNDLPDTFDEALWAIDLYKRMQRKDGAIYGGIETNGHPKPGEAAFLDSLTRYVFAPEPRSSWQYTASAARAAYVFKQLGKEAKSKEYLNSAIRSMVWAEKEYLTRKDYFEGSKNWWQIEDSRNLAALTLYRLTADEKWHKVFKETAIFTDVDIVVEWNNGLQEEAAFIYARLSDDLGDATIKQHAVAGIEAVAKKLIAYSDGISFMWSGPNGDPGFPLILSINAAPWGSSLCRAYSLTKNKNYLSYAIKTSLFSVGANPQNMTFTTRLGHRSPEFPLQCTRFNMHTAKPYSGYTVYGLNQMGPPPSWVTSWFVTKTNSAPNMASWPTSESYWDVESWPMVNENTVHQSMAPAIYVWGYLAGRD